MGRAKNELTDERHDTERKERMKRRCVVAFLGSFRCVLLSQSQAHTMDGVKHACARKSQLFKLMFTFWLVRCLAASLPPVSDWRRHAILFGLIYFVVLFLWPSSRFVCFDLISSCSWHKHTIVVFVAFHWRLPLCSLQIACAVKCIVCFENLSIRPLEMENGKISQNSIHQNRLFFFCNGRIFLAARTDRLSDKFGVLHGVRGSHGFFFAISFMRSASFNFQPLEPM